MVSPRLVIPVCFPRDCGLRVCGWTDEEWLDEDWLDEDWDAEFPYEWRLVCPETVPACAWVEDMPWP